MAKKNNTSAVATKVGSGVFAATRRARNCGSVTAPSNRSLSARSRGATKRQLPHAPQIRPTTIHASPAPSANTAPGRPSSSQPLMSEAPAESAATGAGNALPPIT